MRCDGPCERAAWRRSTERRPDRVWSVDRAVTRCREGETSSVRERGRLSTTSGLQNPASSVSLVIAAIYSGPYGYPRKLGASDKARSNMNKKPSIEATRQGHDYTFI